MEYKITFESKETFSNFLKDIVDIENNKLCIVSSFITKFDNNFNFIIKELLKFKKIELTLHLTHTNITKIPETIFNLETLSFLSLSSNDIDHIPIGICKLKKLEALFIENNKFKKYPFILCELKNLRCVYTRVDNTDCNDVKFLKKKRFIFRLYYILNKKIICNYKILKKLIIYN